MPRRSILSLLMLLALTLGAFLAPQARADDSLGRVTGIVRDTRNQPVNNVIVEIQGGPQLGSTQTVTSGRYSLTDLAPGEYEIVARKAGYGSARKRGVVVEAGAATTLNFRLAWANSDTGAVEVLVTDRNGNTLPAAKVDLMGSGTILSSAFSDADGVATLAGVLPGSYRVKVSRPGFSDANGPTFRVRKETVTRVTVRLRRDPLQVGVLKGQALTVDGDPVNNVLLRLTSQFGEAEARTGRDGAYRFTKLVPGAGYTLQVTASGYASQTRGNITISDLGDTVLNLILLENAPNRGSIVGVLRDDRGFPVALGTVTVTAGPDLGRETLANQEGEFSLTDLRPGEDYAITGTGGGFLPAGASGLDVRAGRTLSVDLTLPAQGVIVGALSGTVKEQGSGKTLSNVIVKVVQGPGTGLAVTTDGAGRFLLDRLSPGDNFALQFQRNGYQIATRTGLTVRAGATTDITVTLAPRGTSVGALVGKVTGLNGKALQNVSVTLTSGASSPRSTTTGKDGTYAFRNLVPDTGYAVRAQKSGYLTETRTNLAVTGGSDLRQNLVLKKGSQVGTLTGQVISVQNVPIPNALVRVTAGPQIPGEVQTNANGLFTFTRLPRGVYTLEVSLTGFRTEQRTGVQVASKQTTRLIVTLQP